MNILYVLNAWPKLSQSFVLNEITELTDRGHNVAVFAIRNDDTDIQHAELENIEILTRFSSKPSLNWHDIVRAFPLVCHPTATVTVSQCHISQPVELGISAVHASEVLSFIDDLPWRPDVIHSHFLDRQSLAAQLSGTAHDIPVTTTAHAYDIWKDGMREHISDWMSSLDRVITISEAHRRHLQNRTLTPVRTVHCGIRPEKFNPSQATISNRFVTVCRFVEKKGLEFGVSAFSELVDKYPALEWHIIGGGDLEDEVRSAIQTHGLEDHIQLLGRVPDEKLIEEVDKAEYFLLPSVIAEDGDRDGVPVAAMEAMAMETVPILGRVDSTGELIENGVNGYMAEVRNGKLVSPKFVEAMQSALESDTKQLATNARKTVVEHFNIETTVGDLEDVFKEVTTSKPVDHPTE